MSLLQKSPDEHGSGLVAEPLDPKRYETFGDDPNERAGILRNFMPSGVKVLDVGCGTGSLSLVVNEGKNNAIFGVEPDPTRAGIANSRGVSTTCGYLTAEYLAAHGPFDVIIFADVLEHLTTPGEILALAHSGLKPGGCLLVSVPNAVHWTMRWDIFFGRFEYMDSGIRDATHLRWFTEATITRLIGASGFKVIEVKQSAGASLPDYSVRRPWAWMKFTHRSRILKMLVRLLPRVFGCQHVILAHKQ